MSQAQTGDLALELKELDAKLRRDRKAVHRQLALRWVYAWMLIKMPGFASQEALKWTGRELPGWMFIMLIIAMLAGLVALFASIRCPGNSWDWQKDLTRSDTILRLVTITDKTARPQLGALLTALWVVRGALYSLQIQQVEERLAPMLLHLEVDEAQALSHEARLYLRDRARKAVTSQMRVAALLVLGELGDKDAAKLARVAQRSADERLKTAGTEVLRMRANLP